MGLFCRILSAKSKISAALSKYGSLSVKKAFIKRVCYFLLTPLTLLQVLYKVKKWFIRLFNAYKKLTKILALKCLKFLNP